MECVGKRKRLEEQNRALAECCADANSENERLQEQLEAERESVERWRSWYGEQTNRALRAEEQYEEQGRELAAHRIALGAKFADWRVRVAAVSEENERLKEQYEVAKRERDEIGAALGEPCAECGHIDWRSDGYLASVEQEWLRLAGVQAARAEELQEQFEVHRSALQALVHALDIDPDFLHEVGREAERRAKEVLKSGAANPEAGSSDPASNPASEPEAS